MPSPQGRELIPRPTATGATAPASATPATPAAAHAEDNGSTPVYAPATRVLRVLPLGAGFALVGLGLGFIGWRMRRS